MRAGRLRHRVTIERAVQGVDADREVTRTWSPLATIWAAVEPVSEREFRASDQTQTERETRVLFRYFGETITPRDRVKFGERYFDIAEVIDRNFRGIDVELRCRERDYGA